MILNKISHQVECANIYLEMIKKETSDILHRMNFSNCEVSTENKRLKALNEMLIHFIADKYDKGTILFYDGHHPEFLTVIQDGKDMDADGCSSVKFSWDRNEGAKLSIER